MREKCPRMTDLVDDGPDYTAKFQQPLHNLIRHLWSVCETQPNNLFDPDVRSQVRTNVEARARRRPRPVDQ